MALEKLEMHDIQDKTRLLDEMNETREGVNEALAGVNAVEKRFATHLKYHEVKKESKAKKTK